MNPIRHLLPILLFGLTVAFAAEPVPTSDFIRIDQFGYLPAGEKIAIIANPKVGYDAEAGQSFAPSTGEDQYQLRRADTHEVVFTGTLTPWKNGEVDPISGDQAWWFDFSSVTAPGRYYVYDVGKKVSSFPFPIGPDVYSDVLRVALRTFFHQRSNFDKPAKFAGENWADGPSFDGPGQDREARLVTDRDNSATAKDLSGGWWDAGDMNKYTGNTSDAVVTLLEAYAENPGVFGDNNVIPESGNGIPDILDEVKWALDWMKKMQLPDGSLLRKIGNAVRPSDDIKATLPPGTDRRPRYYIPACSSATINGAVAFAKGALAFKQFPALAADTRDLQARAIRAFDHYQANPKFVLTNRDLQGGNTDETVDAQERSAVQAAIYLYMLTGDKTYRDYVEKNYLLLTKEFKGGRPYQPSDTASLTEFSRLPGVSPKVRDDVLRLRREGLADSLFVGPTDVSAYGDGMPVMSYHWGNFSSRSSAGTLNHELATGPIDPDRADAYSRRSQRILHTFHGVNPFNWVYLTNMYSYGAKKSINQIYHTAFPDGSDWDDALTSARGGPPPGYLPGGPNKNYKGPSNDGAPRLSPPLNQPPAKAYRDYNTSYPDRAYEITEPGIYYQAHYIRLLSKYATKAEGPLPLPPAGPAKP